MPLTQSGVLFPSELILSQHLSIEMGNTNACWGGAIFQVGHKTEVPLTPAEVSENILFILVQCSPSFLSTSDLI